MKGLVVSLFDLTGVALQPWYDAGYQVLQIDTQLPEGLFQRRPGWYQSNSDCVFAIEVIEQVKKHSNTEVCFVSCFPPCTDLAVSGARWFKAKLEVDPKCQDKAMSLVFLSRDVIEHYEVAGYVENPVSIITSRWRKPDYKFHPWFFTNRVIEDNYTKKTCLWTSEKFRMPDSDVHAKVQKAVDQVIARHGRFISKPDVLAKEVPLTEEEFVFLEEWYPDDRIHKAGPGVERANFRSATPMGWSRAVAEVNRLKDHAQRPTLHAR